MIYLFDIDGTLTTNKEPIPYEVRKVLVPFLSRNPYCHIVTGAPFHAAFEQLGLTATLFNKVFYANGNGWAHVIPESLEIKIIQSKADLENEELYSYVRDKLLWFNWDKRPGMVNCSLVPYRGDALDRYVAERWDKDGKKRQKLCEEIETKFPGYVAKVGGKVSIDIYKEGDGKEQVINYLPDGPITFFADKTDAGGNDADLAEEVLKRGGTVHKVSNPNETVEILERLLNA